MPVALITGGASLICEGMTKCLVSRGWHVVVSDINLAGAELSRQEILHFP